MKKSSIIVIVLIVVIIIIYFISSGNKSEVAPTNNMNSPTSNTNTPSDNPTVPPISNTITPRAPNLSVSISNFAFSPSALSVSVGTKVTWTNNDTVPHTVTSDSGSMLHSPTLAPGESFSFTFTKAGTENYHCNFHQMMKGNITVK